MSEDSNKFTEAVGKVTPLGAVMESLKEGIGAFVDGIGKAFDVVQQDPALSGAWDHGRSEIAAGLFGGSAYVMYPKNAQSQPEHKEALEPSPEVQAPEITPSQEQQQSRGRSM